MNTTWWYLRQASRKYVFPLCPWMAEKASDMMFVYVVYLSPHQMHAYFSTLIRINQNRGTLISVFTPRRLGWVKSCCFPSTPALPTPPLTHTPYTHTRIPNTLLQRGWAGNAGKSCFFRFALRVSAKHLHSRAAELFSFDLTLRFAQNADL